MMFDKKDRALLRDSALVGYCESFNVVAMQDLDTRKRWEKGLKVYAYETAEAIAQCWTDPTVEPESDNP